MGTTLRYDRIMRMLGDGVPYGTIAHEFGTTVGTIRAYDTVRIGRKAPRAAPAGHGMPRKRTELSDDEICRIRDLRAEGASVHEIGETIHRDHKAVAAVLKRLGVESPKQTRFRVQEANRDRIIEAYKSGVGGPVRIAETLGGMTPAMVANVLTKYVYSKNGGGANGQKTDDGDGARGADAG